MLEIKNLTVAKEGKKILRGIDLTLFPGKVDVVMGPNGAGKSTLAKVLAGDPSYEVLRGEVWKDGENLLDLEPEERALRGLFLGFQYPVEIPGITNKQFLAAACNAKRKFLGLPPFSEEEFGRFLEEKMEVCRIKPEFALRNINEGFSGGEKKRNEILQMRILDPDIAVLDETDSGLDIDAMKIVAEGINGYRNANKCLLLITHYERLLEYIRPDFVHVLMDGKIVRSGGAELASILESKGYDWLGEAGAL